MTLPSNIKLDLELKSKWIAALQSGKYLQGHGVLHRGNKFCCLGVLCDLLKNDLGIALNPIPDERDPAETRKITYSYDNSIVLLPQCVIQKTRLSQRGDILLDLNDSKKYGVGQDSTLVELNDSSNNGNGIDFLTIASIIEKYL